MTAPTDNDVLVQIEGLTRVFDLIEALAEPRD